MTAPLVAFAFVLGLVVGSFLNVCILRIPAGESVVRPASHCPQCSRSIAPYDNIPVLSWLWLRGRCRNCKTSISLLYPAVELLTGVLFAACALAFGPTPAALKWAMFCALLVVLAITDLRERILPDKVNLTGAVLGLGWSVALPLDDGTAHWLSSLLFSFPPPGRALSVVDALLGAAAGAGILWLFAEGYFRLRGREGMGLGDVKMMAMAGTFLGARAAVLTIMAGALLGSVLGAAFMLFRRTGSEYELPFGTFLAGAALLAVFYGPPVLAWYFGRLQ
ncbi:MAG TPA: prepilin peptidase [Candidatus Binatia bacterium]|nr:prepilin peptidase [Candidatus Binatia bacterium]